MDKDYQRIYRLKEEISKLKEKKVSLQAVISTLTEERNRYLTTLRNKYNIRIEDLENEINKYKNKISEIETKISKIKEVLSKFLV
ncbi:MAG: hypothetical protein QXI58_02255 [Candidatus Micrarchaeia archaeon]